MNKDELLNAFQKAKTLYFAEIKHRECIDEAIERWQHSKDNSRHKHISRLEERRTASELRLAQYRKDVERLDKELCCRHISHEKFAQEKKLKNC